MNIGIDIRPLLSPVRTGIGEYTYELLSAIFKLDKENQYFLFYNSAKIPHKSQIAKTESQIDDFGWAGENINYIHTRWPNKLFNASIKIFRYPKLDKIISKNLDVFFSPNMGFTAISPRTHFVLTVHDLSFLFFPEFFSLKQRLWHALINPKKQCERADFILAPSENTKQDIINFYGVNADKIKVIYPGLSVDFQETIPSTRDKKYITTDKIKKKYFLPDEFILFLGAIEPRKNIAGLIKAFEIAHRSPVSSPNTNYPDVSIGTPTLRRGSIQNTHLIIAGAPGWKNSAVYKQALSSPVKEKIKFLGFVEPEDKPALYAAASLFVYPSFYEGFGFPVLEAMSMGTPVITSNRSSLPEITGNAAYLIDPNRPAEIAAAMAELLANQNLRERQIKNGFIQSAKFSWDRAAGEWLKSIENYAHWH